MLFHFLASRLLKIFHSFHPNAMQAIQFFLLPRTERTPHICSLIASYNILCVPVKYMTGSYNNGKQAGMNTVPGTQSWPLSPRGELGHHPSHRHSAERQEEHERTIVEIEKNKFLVRTGTTQSHVIYEFRFLGQVDMFTNPKSIDREREKGKHQLKCSKGGQTNCTKKLHVRT